MTQKQAITKAVFAGRKLTMMDGFLMFGTMNLHKRISEIETKWGVRLNRKEKKIKTRYGTNVVCTEYQLDKNKYSKEVAKYKSK
jgi:hypothetical protein